MKLKSILAGLENLKAKGEIELDIPNIENDSRKVQPGDMFIAIKGFKNDGTEYIKDAIANGARVILAPDDTDKEIIKQIPEGVTIILHPDTRYALAICSCNFYENPSSKFKLVGVTGTKGKSTTTSLLYNIIKDQNENTFLLGNIGNPILDYIEQFNEESILVIEMSSHQLEFVKESPHIGVILNLYQDHLDHTGTLEKYHNDKMHMFKYQDKSDIGIYDGQNEYLINLINKKTL